MKILNPLYDNAFKYLMEDNNIAKTVLSIILDTDIISLQAKPQETVLHNGLFRFDYKAVIKEDNGDSKTILVEVQKYNSPDPIKRFRDYLGVNYATTETIQTADGEEVEVTLPLVTIYILGFNVTNVDCRIIKVDNTPYDVVTGEILKVKSKFIEQLTHKSYILIAKSKDNTTKTTLVEQLLDLFIQKLRGEKSNPVINIDEDTYNNELIPIIERLKRATLDEEILRKVKLEQDFIDSETSKDEQLKKALIREEAAKKREKEERKQKEEARLIVEEERRQKEAAKKKEEEALRQKEAAKKREEEERSQKEAAEQKAKATMQKFAKSLISFGVSIDDIMKQTGLTESEIKDLM